MNKELLECKEENLKLKHRLNKNDYEYLNNRIDLLHERITKLENKSDYEPTPDGVAYPYWGKLRNLF